MAVFGGYESELVAMAESSRARIEAVAEMAEGTERRALKDAVEASIASAKELLEQMELEVASSARTERCYPWPSPRRVSPVRQKALVHRLNWRSCIA
eukprot:6207573-Pleurochrysis_carterae.AAC.2